ncbi:MAG: hypothetical protein OEV92_05500 [Nitrospinota bacterium]|nr:hypothetical protein [Nitrospinota bacterium]
MKDRIIGFVLGGLLVMILNVFYVLFADLKKETDEIQYALRIEMKNNTGKQLLVQLNPLYLGDGALPRYYSHVVMDGGYQEVRHIEKVGSVEMYLGRKVDTKKLYLVMMLWSRDNLLDEISGRKPFRMYILHNGKHELSPENYMPYVSVIVDNDLEKESLSYPDSTSEKVKPRLSAIIAFPNEVSNKMSIGGGGFMPFSFAYQNLLVTHGPLGAQSILD